MSFGCGVILKVLKIFVKILKIIGEKAGKFCE
jgi:hypothetical protein